MNIQMALLADSANVSREGKLNIVGCFDCVNAATYPAQHHGSVLVVRIAASPLEYGTDATLNIRLVHEGTPVMEGNFPFHVPETSSDLSATIGVIVNMPVIPLPEPGTYVFHLALEGSDGSYVPFTARVVPEGSGQAA